MREVTGNEFYF